MALVILTVFVIDFYVESFCLSKLEGHLTAKVGSTASFLAAIVFAVLWDQPWAWSIHEWHHGNTTGVKHLLSGGTVFSAMFFILGRKTFIYLNLTQLRLYGSNFQIFFMVRFFSKSFRLSFVRSG
jgi:TRAP-type mannitol/chloroaromatic compound transport system permease large subunit